VKEIDLAKTAELEEKFDPRCGSGARAARGADRRRPADRPLLLPLLHGRFGLLRETTHRGVTSPSCWARVPGLPMRKALLERGRPSSWLRRAGCRCWTGAGDRDRRVGALHPWIFDDLAFRVGNPLPLDVVMGSVLVILLLEATRRAMAGRCR